MAKKGDDLFWKILIGAGAVVAGTMLLDHLQSGQGPENDAKLVPDTLEGKIDRIVKKLNDKFGHEWVNEGLNALRVYLRGALPWAAVALVDVIYLVEHSSRNSILPVPGYAKQQAAMQRARTEA